MITFVFEGKLQTDTEDGGQAKIGEFESYSHPHIFVRVQSWDETKQHPEYASLEGKKLRITVETIED